MKTFLLVVQAVKRNDKDSAIIDDWQRLNNDRIEREIQRKVPWINRSGIHYIRSRMFVNSRLIGAPRRAASLLPVIYVRAALLGALPAENPLIHLLYNRKIACDAETKYARFGVHSY